MSKAVVKKFLEGSHCLKRFLRGELFNLLQDIKEGGLTGPGQPLPTTSSAHAHKPMMPSEENNLFMT